MRYFLIIYQGLKPEVIYWEFINTARKIVILLLYLFDMVIAINLSLVILLLTARIQIVLKPYKNRENNKIEFLSVMGGVSIFMAALVYTRYEQHSILNAIVFTAVILINLKFLKEWLFRVLQIHRDKNQAVELMLILLGKICCKKIPKSKTEIRKERGEKSKKLSERKKKEIDIDSGSNTKKISKNQRKFKRRGKRRKKIKRFKSPRKLPNIPQISHQNYINDDKCTFLILNSPKAILSTVKLFPTPQNPQNDQAYPKFLRESPNLRPLADPSIDNSPCSMLRSSSNRDSERILVKHTTRARNVGVEIDLKENHEVIWTNRRVM